MKTRRSCGQATKVSHSRWLAYATASAATALAGNNSAEAAIHYSGRLDVTFPPHNDYAKTFPLDQAGDFISFARLETGRFGATDAAYFRVYGIASAAWRGFRYGTYYVYVSKLHVGQNFSRGFFTSLGFDGSGGFLDRFGYSFPWGQSQWRDRGIGYVGFRFNNGAGIQYGWARVWMRGHPENAFKVIDYAYADPGEPIRAGQRSSDEQASDQGSTDEQAPDQGSLGGLALGAVGLLAWRKSRSRAARLTAMQDERCCPNQ
jgi:hypothetical protein